MDYASRGHKFGPKMLFKGSGTSARGESNDRHTLHGRRVRRFLKSRVGTSIYYLDHEPKALTDQPGVPTKDDEPSQASAVEPAMEQSTQHDQVGESSTNYSREHQPHGSEPWI